MDVPYRRSVFLLQSIRYHDSNADSRPKMATMKRPTVLPAIRPELTVMEDHDDPRSTTVIPQEEPRTVHKLLLLLLLLLSVFSIRAPPHHPWPVRKQTCGLEPEIALQRISTAQRSIFTVSSRVQAQAAGCITPYGVPRELVPTGFPPSCYLAYLLSPRAFVSRLTGDYASRIAAVPALCPIANP